MYSTEWCGYCERAKALLERRGLEYEEIRIDHEPNFRERLHGLTGGWTVPQIVIDGTPIGGYLELWRLDREGILAAGTTAPGHEDRSSPQELDTDGNLAA